MRIHLPASVSSFSIPPAWRQPQPQRDWLLLMSVAGILLLLSIAWNMWFFLRTTNAEVALPSDTTMDTIPPDLIPNLERVFEERRQEETRYRSEYEFVDPSV